MPSLSDGLQGKINGVIMTASSGAPGSKSQISIRGKGEPLFIIDGVIRSKNDFENINPNDVDNISVLKDAAATSVYGSTAANGAILITTKVGKAGSQDINYSFNQIWSRPTIYPKKMNSYDRFSAVDKVLKAEGQAGYDPQILQYYKDQTKPYEYPDVDWQKLFLKNAAPEQRHDLSYSGGTDNLKLYSSLSYFDQGSILKTNISYNRRLTYRLSAISTFDKINLTVRSQLDGFTEKNSIPASSTANSYGHLFGHIQDQDPNQLAYNEFGLPYSGTVDNPAIELSPLSGYSRSESRVNTATLNFDYAAPFLPGLHLKFNTTYNYWSSRSKTWNATAPSYALNSHTAILGNPPSLSESRGEGNFLNLQWFITYNKTFGNHGVDFTGVYEQYQDKSSNLNGSRVKYQIIYDQFLAGPTTDMTVNGGESESARASYVFKFGYNYKERYFIDFSGRYDGNDRYPRNKRWGLFPSVSGSYIISDEPFMSRLREKHILDLLKIRASYGTVGLNNGEFGSFAYIPGYSINNNAWVVNDVLVQGTSEPSSIPSMNYTWYSTKSRNFGLDFASLNNKLSGSIDYYFTRTTGYAGPDNSKYSGTLGIGLPPVNIPKKAYRSEGTEFILRWQDRIAKDFYYKLTGTFTYSDWLWENYNENDADIRNPYSRVSGVPQNYAGNGYINLGFYQSNQELLDGPRRISSLNTVGGDLKYKDANGDGKIDGSDFRRIGSNSFPRINFGFTIDLEYKGLYFTTTIAGSGNRDRYLGGVIQGSSGQGYLVYKFQTDYWRPDNTNALFPRQVSTTGVNGNNNFTSSDFWYLRSGYLRVKFLQLGYDLKYSVFKKQDFIKHLKVFVSGSNLLTYAKSLDYYIDPESDTNNYNYPIQKTISLGLNIGF